MGRAPALSPEVLARSRRAQTETESRVRSLIRQMRSDDAAESIIVDAERAAANGDPDAKKYLRVEPTAEMLAKGDFETVEARLLHQHDIRTTTKRRVLMSKVVSLHYAGVIDNEQLIACRWYRDCWEATGLIGLIPSTDYSKEVFAPPQSRDMFNAFQLDALENYRKAKGAITARWVPFFEAVVLEDVGLRRAILLSRGDNTKSKGIFRECVVELQTVYDQLKVVDRSKQ